MAVQIQITPNGNEDQSQVSKERKWDKVLADGSGLITLRYWRLKPLGGGGCGFEGGSNAQVCVRKLIFVCW